MENCGNCRFSNGSFCLRFPPSQVGNGTSRFPIIFPNLWCGEWKTKETVDQTVNEWLRKETQITDKDLFKQFYEKRLREAKQAKRDKDLFKQFYEKRLREAKQAKRDKDLFKQFYEKRLREAEVNVYPWHWRDE